MLSNDFFGLKIKFCWTTITVFMTWMIACASVDLLFALLLPAIGSNLHSAEQVNMKQCTF